MNENYKGNAAIAMGALAYTILALVIGVSFFRDDLWLGATPPHPVSTAILESALPSGNAARSIAASEGAWRATRVLAYLASLQLILGVLGVIYLARTFRETRETLRLTGESNKASYEAAKLTRASQIAHVYGMFQSIEDERVGGSVATSLKVKNLGRTVARDVKVTAFQYRENSWSETDLEIICREQWIGPLGAGSEELVQDVLLPYSLLIDQPEHYREVFCMIIEYKCVDKRCETSVDSIALRVGERGLTTYERAAPWARIHVGLSRDAYLEDADLSTADIVEKLRNWDEGKQGQDEILKK